ncbi:FxSxx-COOH system tetratricopeptide repeat protein [Solwaraspora sp. WMMA2080]|uniref:FxSxx-COOH system tetratricopeptide repeat protein n=1 Tax=unclassified Solwaraspora TaxID=2627926 RepID=UPI00248BD87F|nr:MULTISPECIES: FxSxx-COOH system tetratricopeptide repeat protein [unclassified Solwaraspora]WBB99796.1 FxSxx-COOH system tetratricopeptide repeat protein [Solwaraspora sp. WMMA2059]WBC21656.1 FxSxx-COOH system tetratricopeptide repeat protein [Solwaraspora sp. WMMA2080]
MMDSLSSRGSAFAVRPTLPEPARQLEIAGRREVLVVIDDDPVMEFWSDEFADFLAMLREQECFASVSVRSVVVADGAVRWRDAPHAPLTVPSGDGGPPVVFLVTHGRSPAWTTGLIFPVLVGWAALAALAVVNVLPQQHWYDRGMDTAEVLWTPASARLPTAERPWRTSVPDPWSAAEPGGPERTAVPVIERGGDWLSRWARLLAGATAGTVRMPALLVSLSDRVAGSGRVPRWSRSTLRASELVARFRAKASPRAFALATRLAAAPLTSRIIRAVQRTAGRLDPAHLTEVLTSDLMRPVRHGGGTSGDDTRLRYEFRHGVRDQLLASSYRDRIIEVQYTVESELGRDIEAVRNLTRRVRSPRQATYPRVTPASEPFLRVELAVHVALGGPNLVAAERLGWALGSPVRARRSRNPATNPQASHTGMEPTMSDIMASPGAPFPFGARQQTPHPGPDPEGSAVSPTGSVVPPTTAVLRTQRRDQQPAVVGNLPPRNANFTGRRALLDTLHQRLRAGTTAVLPEAVHGAGGVGKSQLVVEYVYQHQQDFDLIWWISAERPAQIQSALAELASRLDLQVPATANTAVPAVLDALRIGRPYANWLLVFDNAEDPDDVERFFPRGGPGSIVVTSRDPRWGQIASGLPVDVFDRQESIELLRRRGPDLLVSDAERLAAALGDLPLAIEQAAAWRAETTMTADEYLQLLHDSQPDVDDVTEVEQDYPPLVAAAWHISLNGLRERDPSALRLLQVCAFFASEPIGRSLLSKPRLQIHPDLDPLVRSPIRLKQAIRTIGRLSLARIDHRTNSLQMHRLVQRVLIHQMSEQDRKDLRHSAHLLLAGNDPDEPDDADHWPRYAELYPHIVASGAETCRNELVRDMVLNEAKYLWRWGDHIGARDLAQRAYRSWIDRGDDTDPDSLRMATWLGFMYFVVGDYAAAAKLNARTLQLYRQTVGDIEEETLDALGAVAADHRVAGDFDGALERSITVYEQSKRNFGDEEPFTLRAAHNLAVSMRLSGLFGRALQLDEQTYEQLVHIYGTDHPVSLNTLGGINLDRRELGDYVTAHASQENLVADARRVLKYDDHPDLVRQSHQLAGFRRKAGQHHEALDLSTDALRRFRIRYGDDHPDSVLANLTVSIDLRVTGDLRAARQAGEAAVQGLRALYGEDHPHTAGAQVDLAVTLRLLGEHEQAREMADEGLRRLTQRLGGSHALVFAARVNLASALYELGEYETARALDAETFDSCTEQLGPGHPITLACGVNLAMDLRGLGQDSQASLLFDDIVDRFRSTFGELHPATAAAAAGVRANCDIDPLPL